MLETSDQPLLLARNVTKTFGATTALRAFDFTLWPGRVHALIGENGAGKSTFIKVLAGLHQADEGTIDIVHSSGDEPVIAFIHQDLGLIPGMSAAENVILGSQYPKKGGLVSWTAVKERARESLLKIGAAFDPGTSNRATRRRRPRARRYRPRNSSKCSNSRLGRTNCNIARQ